MSSLFINKIALSAGISLDSNLITFTALVLSFAVLNEDLTFQEHQGSFYVK